MKKLWFKIKFWLAPVRVSVDHTTADYDTVVEAKMVDGTVYVIKEYKRYTSVDAYQRALFGRLRPNLKRALEPDPRVEGLLKWAKGEEK